jgi:signal transduction histidine kinase
MGKTPKLIDAPVTAAQTHALLRARSGFDINQLAAEYRALRASVLRLWIDDCVPEVPNLDDMIRFNEAIDQALAESVGYFSEQVDQARNLFLGMLGHDMRSPLQTIQMTALYLARLSAGEQVMGAASRLINSGARMQALLNDMLDFNRTKLGMGIDIVPSAVDLAKLVADELDQLRAAHPQHRLDLEVVGDSRGVWDGQRLQQLLANLVMNAIKYGAPSAPVRVVVTGDTEEVRLEVKNMGEAIDTLSLERIFDPLQRGPLHERRHEADGSLGLGLYIVREIAKAHRGEISARSDKTETVFTVRLPRRGQYS